MPEWLGDQLAAGVGAVCLFGGNIVDDDQLAALVAELRSANPDVVITTDEEGGDVTRLDVRDGSPYPGAATLGAADDVAATRAVYRLIGRRLAAAGVDVDLAPVADVNTDPRNPVIGVRSFGASPDLAARHAAAAVAGLADVGVAACLKHFPGHGATNVDSHEGLPTIDVDLDTWRTRELVPFAAGVDAGAAAVMSAHLRMPALDPTDPATSSSAILERLRADTGFTGAIISDALDMAGIHVTQGVRHQVSQSAPRFGTIGAELIATAAVRSLTAGIDLLCLGSMQGADVPAAVTAALVAAVESGVVSEQRLADAAGRVAGMQRRGAAVADTFDIASDEQLGRDAARAALRIDGEITPRDGAVVVECSAVLSAANHLDTPFATIYAAADPTSTHSVATSDTTVDDLRQIVGDRRLVLVVRGAATQPWQADLAAAVSTAFADVVVVDLGWPSPDRPWSAPTISTHGASVANSAAATGVLVPGDS